MGEMELQTSGVWRSDSTAEAAGLHTGGGCLPGRQWVKRWDGSVAKSKSLENGRLKFYSWLCQTSCAMPSQELCCLGLELCTCSSTRNRQSTGGHRYRQHCHSCLLWAQWHCDTQTAQISLLNTFHSCFYLLMKMSVTDNTSCALGKPTANFNHLSKLNVHTLQ